MASSSRRGLSFARKASRVSGTALPRRACRRPGRRCSFASTSASSCPPLPTRQRGGWHPRRRWRPRRRSARLQRPWCFIPSRFSAAARRRRCGGRPRPWRRSHGRCGEQKVRARFTRYGPLGDDGGEGQASILGGVRTGRKCGHDGRARGVRTLLCEWRGSPVVRGTRFPWGGELRSAIAVLLYLGSCRGLTTLPIPSARQWLTNPIICVLLFPRAALRAALGSPSPYFATSDPPACPLYDGALPSSLPPPSCPVVWSTFPFLHPY